MVTSSPVTMRAPAGRPTRGTAGITAVLTLLFASGAAYAAPPRGHAFNAHFAAAHGPHGGAFQGPRGGGGPQRQGPHWAGHAPQIAWHAGGPQRGQWQGGGGAQWHAGGPPRGQWHGGGGQWHGGGAQWHGGGDPHWHGHHGGWRDNRWHAGWGGDNWDHRDWRGAAWLGGYWGGYYWPPVNYGWNYPWFMASIPFGAVTLSFGGTPYYYVNRVYYSWNPYYNGYVVTDPPPVAVQTPSTAQAVGPAPQYSGGGGGVLSLRVTPLRGQDAQQTANDRYACNTWAVGQSGFDPLNARQDALASASVRADYRRAFAACLSARGYSVQ